MDPHSKLASLRAQLEGETTASKKAHIYEEVPVYAEMCARLDAGLPPYHGADLNDLFFPHAKAEATEFVTLASQACEENPDSVGNFARKTAALFCNGARSEIEDDLARIRPYVSGHVWENVTFDKAFYRGLSAARESEIVQDLPQLRWVAELPASSSDILFIASDFKYFTAFGVPLIKSIAAAGTADIHVHIMDCPIDAEPATLSILQSFGIPFALTVERSGGKLGSNYYHSARLIRLYQLVGHYHRPMWLMDVDALFNRSPQSIFPVLAGSDIAMRVRPGRVEPWHQMNACLIGVTPADRSMQYIKMIAAYVAHFFRLNKLQWGIDQMAMFGCYEFLNSTNRAPALSFLDPHILDYAYLDSGIIWCNSGSRKLAQIKRAPGAPVPPEDQERARYIFLFDKYRALSLEGGAQI